MKKKLISLVLVLCMLISELPVQVMAAYLPENERGTLLAENTSSEQNAQVPFLDVGADQWFYEAAQYVYENQLFSGTSDTAFSPQGSMTRAMFVTVLGRIAQIDVSAYRNKAVFSDVSADAYCAPYAAWAAEAGITYGVGEGNFAPNMLINRAQMAALIVRYMDYSGVALTAETVVTVPADFDDIPEYAREPVLKLWRFGFFKGDSSGRFNPSDNASRAEAATLSMRLDRHLVNTGAKNPIIPPVVLSPSLPPPAHGGGTVYHTLSFATNGGSIIENKEWNSKAALFGLPIPFKQDAIFLGWCYDNALEKPVSTSDRPTGDMTLYAKYQETGQLEENETPPFASALDQDTDFTITVLAVGDLTSDEVKAGITAKNLNQQEQTDFITVTGGDGKFTISGGANGFEAGATYKLTLTNDALTFEGYETSVRDFNFTTAKAETLNLTLNSSLTYIPMENISNITENGLKVAELISPLALVSETAVTAGEMAEGTFEYNGILKVGDTVSIYEGLSPEVRTLDTDNEGDVAYVTITAVNGKIYSYKSAEEKEVLFTPDVLPMPADADEDGNAEDNSITVDASVLDYSGDIYANIGLDSQTVVEEGDYIAFYSGEFGEDSAEDIRYGKITSISKDASTTYIITYEDVSEDEVLASMDVYNTKEVSGDTLLEGSDKVAIEKSIEKQVIESGFADEAGRYLAALALETDSFTKLNEDFDLTEYTIKKSDGTRPTQSDLELMEGQSVTVTTKKAEVKLSTTLQHFNGEPGLRLTLELDVMVTVYTSNGEQIVMEIVGTFEQEVKLGLNISGGADWKKWGGIFPYIDDIRINANVDLYDFTGVSIHATLVTRSKDLKLGWVDNEQLKNISDEIEKLFEQKDSSLGSGKGTIEQELAQKYADMIGKNSDWVQLYSKELAKSEGSIDPFNIIAYEVCLNFVIKADLNISIGCEFWYENGKRYSYNLRLFSRKATSDTINLKDERYELQFYVMGTLGLKAGVELTMKVGIFSTDLNSIGLSAEVGIYAKLYGYFYYHLTYSASQGRTSKSAGALYFELGIYLEIGFEAQALSGKISYSPTLYYNEWPLWTAGVQVDVLDFSYTASPELTMKRKNHEFLVPDSYFTMKYLDLKTGESGMKAYDDATKFKIEVTNPAFVYNPTNNILSVTPGDKRSQDGQMIVTWIPEMAAFTSTPITRRMNLHWDDYSNEYSISFNTCGGSVVPLITAKPGGVVAIPTKPTKQGYDFAGWFSDADFKNPYTFPDVMPDDDTTVYVKWTESNNTPYTVEHYKQELNGNFALADTGKFTGTTGVTTNPEPKTYVGFNTPAKQILLILADGSAVVRYEYTRAEYTVTFSLGTAGDGSTPIKLKYGALITAPVFNSKGYIFAGWDKVLAETMPAENISYTALWEPTDTDYRVEHYVEQQEIGKYALTGKQENLKAQTGRVLNEANLVNNDLLVPNGIELEKITVNGETVPSTKVLADGTLLVKVYYKRLSNTLTFKLQNGQADIVSQVRYGDPVTAPTGLTRAGYNFGGWDLDMVTTMPAGSLTYTAQWTERNDTPYIVKHYQQNSEDNGYTLCDTENLIGTTDAAVVATPKSYPNFSVNSNAAGYKATGNIKGDGSEVLSLYYDRAVFTVTFEKLWEQAVLNGVRDVDYKFGAAVSTPIPTLTGYTFVGWYLANESEFNRIMPAADTTVYARWTPNQVNYTVEHYVMGVDGNYRYETSDSNSGTAGNVLTLANLKKPSLEIAGGIVYHHAEVGGNTVTSTSTLPDGTLIVKLYYERKQYTLTWNLGGGSATNIYTNNGLIYYGAALTAPELIWAGYSYTWNNQLVGTMPANDLTYTALWTAGGYTVNFNANGGSGTMADQTFAYGSSKALTANTFTRPYYTFINWNTMANGGGTKYNDGQSVINLTSVGGTVILYAQWQNIAYDITYYLDGGVNSTGNPTTYTGQSDIWLGEPTRTGFIFVGWYTDSGYTSSAGFPAIAAGSTGARSFYAKWSPSGGGYTVTFHANLGSGEMPSQAFIIDQAQKLSANTFTRNGYKFDGWALSPDQKVVVYNNEQSVSNLAAAGGNLDLYAFWWVKTYWISYSLNDGGEAVWGVLPASYNIESDTIILPTPIESRPGYDFIGWCTDPELTVIETTIPKGSTGDRGYYAKWERKATGALKVTNNGNNDLNIAYVDGITQYDNTAVILHGTSQDTLAYTDPDASMFNCNVTPASGSWPLSALDRAEGALGAGVRIALIDTGISTKAISPEHLADGKNYIDPNAGTQDRLSHGTAVAGILAGSNEKGIVGVAPAATLVPLVYCTSDGDGVIKGDSELLAQIIRDAVDVYGCRIINISSGTTNDNRELRAAVAYAEEHGALVVSSVGNDNNEYPERLYYPAAYDTVIGVAALRQDGEVACFSQRNTSVDLCAPGDDLRVLRKGGTTTKTFGTSFAAAYVSGATAVLLAEHPELTPSQVRRILCASALDIGNPGYDIESGWGQVQIGASLDWAAVGQQFRDVTANKGYFEAVH